jgi:hypothetical protein
MVCANEKVGTLMIKFNNDFFVVLKVDYSTHFNFMKMALAFN